MEGFNKVISFVLGLVVVIVFFSVLKNKLNLKNVGQTIVSKTKATTQKVTPTLTPTPTQIIKKTTSTKTASSIPSTGIPVFFIPTLLAGAFVGGALRKTGEK